jgi:hypothetical protein
MFVLQSRELLGFDDLFESGLTVIRMTVSGNPATLTNTPKPARLLLARLRRRADFPGNRA